MVDSWLHDHGPTIMKNFNHDNVNPASYDLTLGALRVPNPAWFVVGEEKADEMEKDGVGKWIAYPGRVFRLRPLMSVLCYSEEVMNLLPMDMRCLLLGKSGLIEKGLAVGQTGLGDPGFNNSQWRWLLTNCCPWPVDVEIGKRYVQITFEALAVRPDVSYATTGNHNGIFANPIGVL